MTARQLYLNVLIELNKSKAPSMLLEDFNYLANKMIYSYINKRYAIYDTTQQTTDDLRVLRSQVMFTTLDSEKEDFGSIEKQQNYGGVYEGTYVCLLPTDYYHILNCVIEFAPLTAKACVLNKSTLFSTAKKLTSDMWPNIISNYYNRPSFKHAYYILSNGFHTSKDLLYNQYTSSDDHQGLGFGTDYYKEEDPTRILDTEEELSVYEQNITRNNLSRTMKVGAEDIDLVNRVGGMRYGNASGVNLEIRVGDDRSHELIHVYVDYLKAPQNINLTEEQIDLVNDTSQILEFPDYVCYEIINELTHAFMENMSDSRLSTHPAVSTSVDTPVQAAQQQ